MHKPRLLYFGEGSVQLEIARHRNQRAALFERISERPVCRDSLDARVDGRQLELEAFLALGDETPPHPLKVDLPVAIVQDPG
jgi:hypothetical protein